eukprot:TRINITY_DN7122_c0_g1_i1.p1 TRINITY_DN7122_c0_g1~~TRINITY_DN7122_c0_g1_i1.p1  ORF type:complete len:726 (+),score=211.30 TRINITY_DN7122_c0_g1_i1:59-2236(+)
MADAPFFENLRKLINVVDDLRDVGLGQYINLPRITVLGTQSSGKSSLLESIVGLDFLPRGEGVVTRRPLELRLVRTPSLAQPYGEFDAFKGEKLTDFQKVKEKINELTDKVAGKNKGIVDDPIILTVYSPTCPDLTVIDLPGITRIPLAGSDQPKDIEKITRDMAGRYCRDPRTIILCVVPANADLSTSDALQMARELDPDGNRTLGVFTKIDIMDKGTSAKKMLLGQEIPLKYGYVGVKNRSQHDINNGMTVKKALEIERDYFATHPVYSTMPTGYIGTENLVQRLTNILYSHIRKCLPDIIREINNRTRECESRLKELGPPLPRENTEKMQLVWNMITEFTEKYKNVIKGKYDAMRIGESKAISSGSIIKKYFYDLYDDLLEKDKKHVSCKYKDTDISRAIRLHQGDSIPGFLSIDSFLYLIHPLLQDLKEPAVDCLNRIYDHLEDIATGIINKVFERFPTLMADMIENVIQVLQSRRDATREMIDNIMEFENSYIFTNDDDYLANRSIVVSQKDGEKKKENVDTNQAFVNEMRSRIESYFTIVVRNNRDSIPKIIGHFLVKKSMDEMQYSLYNAINKNPMIFKMIGDPEHIINERDNLHKKLETLKKAQKVLKRDPDLAVMPVFEDTGDYTSKDYIQRSTSKNEKDSARESDGSGNVPVMEKRKKSLENIAEPRSITQPSPVNSNNTSSTNVLESKPAPKPSNSLFGSSAPAKPSNSLFGNK